MKSDQDLIAQINDLFHPRSVAVVGAPRGMKTGTVFLMALLEQGFSGPIYPVNPQAEEISGIKAYPKMADIPGPVDLAIILVPHWNSIAVVKECADKGVKGAVLFTAGYKETGTAEGKALEEEVVRLARGAGMRLIGPNGMGLYCPRSGLSFFPRGFEEARAGRDRLRPAARSLIFWGGPPTERDRLQQGDQFGKRVRSYCSGFFVLIGSDPETGLIGSYIEGIKNGPYCLRALRKASL